MQPKPCKYCEILIYWILDPEGRGAKGGGPKYSPMEYSTAKKHQCSKYDPPEHSGRAYNVHNPLEFSAWFKKFLLMDMQRGKVWCLACNIAHESHNVCFFIKSAGFVEHTDFNERQYWTQPCTFFKRIHLAIFEEKARERAGKDGSERPAHSKERRILAAE